jgi:O-antigen ligase
VPGRINGADWADYGGLMDFTTMLAAALGLSVAVLVVIIMVTSKAKMRHAFPSGIVYFAVAASITLSLLSPRLTSTSATEITESGAAGSVARVVTFATVGIFLAALAYALAKRTRLHPVAGAVIAYGAVGFLSALVNGQPFEGGSAYLYLVVAALGLTAAWAMPDAIRVVRRCLRVYVWGSLALIFISPAMAFWDVQGRELFGVKQLAGVTTHPNGLGTVAAIAIFAELLRLGGRRARPWHLMAAVVVLVLTQSRGAWLAAALGVLFWLIGRAKNSSVGVAAPLMAGVLLVMVWFGDTILGWVQGTTDQRDFSTLNGRTVIWEQALAPVGDSPLLGKGPLVFDTRFRWDALGLDTDAGHSNAHNQIIQTLVERGFLGLLVLAVFVVVMLRAAWRQPLVYRGPVLAIVMLFVSWFAVETPLYVSTASLNAAILVLIVTLLTAQPGLGGESEADELRPDVVHQGLRGRGVGSGSRDARGLHNGGRTKERQLRG